MWRLGQPDGDGEQKNRASSEKFHSGNSDIWREGWQARALGIAYGRICPDIEHKETKSLAHETHQRHKSVFEVGTIALRDLASFGVFSG